MLTFFSGFMWPRSRSFKSQGQNVIPQRKALVQSNIVYKFKGNRPPNKTRAVRMTHMPPSSACPSDTLKHLGSSTQYDQLPYQVWWASVKALSRYCAEMAFTLKVAATLTFDLVTPKSKGVFYTLWPTSLQSLVKLGQSILKISRRNSF